MVHKQSIPNESSLLLHTYFKRYPPMIFQFWYVCETVCQISLWSVLNWQRNGLEEISSGVIARSFGSNNFSSQNIFPIDINCTMLALATSKIVQTGWCCKIKVADWWREGIFAKRNYPDFIENFVNALFKDPFQNHVDTLPNKETSCDSWRLGTLQVNEEPNDKARPCLTYINSIWKSPRSDSKRFLPTTIWVPSLFMSISASFFISFWMGMKSTLVNFRHGTMSRLLNSHFQNRVHFSTEHDKIEMLLERPLCFSWGPRWNNGL